MKIKTLNSVCALIGMRNTTLPMLENFYITKDHLYLTNLAISVRVTHKYPVAIDSKPLVIHAHYFLKRMATIRAPFSISSDDAGKITFSSASSKSTISGSFPDDYSTSLRQEAPGDNDKPIFSLSAWDIHMLNVASGFVANDELRPVMQMVVIDQKYIVASDAHKLYFRKTDKSYDEQVLFELPVIKLMVMGSGQTFDIYKMGKNYCAQSEDMLIWWRMFDATRDPGDLFFRPGLKYPAWEKVIPAALNKVIIPVKELITAIKSVEYAANAANDRILFEISGNKLSVSANDLDFDMLAIDEVRIINDGGSKIEFRFKAAYILKILKCLLDEGYYQVEMGFSENSKAFIFADKFLLMPMMLNY
jgi:DNA polymerase III sliding clamp (beta) subunit (PCNA family)